MKKLLLASTILGLAAGTAAAEITLSGDARMGLVDDFGATGPVFNSRARVKFTLSGESDTGFTFGGEFRANDAAGAASGTAGSVFISGAFGKLSMGDVDSAAQAAVGQVDGVGYTGLSDLNEITYIAAGGSNGEFSDYSFFNGAGLSVTGDPTVLYEYSAGAASLYASVTQRNYSYDDGFDIWEGEAYSVGGAYTMGGYKFSAGYERFEQSSPTRTSNADNLVLGADATFGAIAVKARVAQGGSAYDGLDFQDNNQWALSATYTMDAMALTAFASNVSVEVSGSNVVERNAVGLGASYDLGGGAKVAGGIVRRGTTTGAAAEVTDNAADIGLSFSF